MASNTSYDYATITGKKEEKKNKRMSYALGH